MKQPLETDTRFIIANKEALLCLALTLANFIWWYGFAYGLGSGSVEHYTYIMGLPTWFFFSCVAGFPVFAVLAWLMVRFFFTNLSLDPHDPETNQEIQP